MAQSTAVQRYEVEPLLSPVEAKRAKYNGNGILGHEIVEEPGGYMVYFPKGHSIRVRTRAELERLGFHKKPKRVAMDVDVDTHEEEDDPQTITPKQLVAKRTTRRGGRTATAEEVLGDAGEGDI